VNRTIPLVRRKPMTAGPASNRSPVASDPRRFRHPFVSSAGRLIRHSLTTRLAALTLALLALTGVFADLLAGDGPILLLSPSGVAFLPAITEPARFAGMRSDQIAATLPPSAVAWWPLVRSGPSLPTADAALAPPSPQHPLGTDAFRRDVFARLTHGTRVALGLGLVAAALATALGFVTGAGAAVLGGNWDALVERATEVVSIYPAVIVIALVRAIERTPTLESLLLVVTLFRWAEMARISRVAALRCLAEDWALAARALGASRARLVATHVTRAAASSVLVSAVVSFAGVVLTESALSFLGLGVPPTFPSWGEMMGEVSWGAGPTLVLLPALLLGTTLVSLYLLADAFGQRLEPRR
jgi:peptide/nickel transport system permease protein